MILNHGFENSVLDEGVKFSDGSCGVINLSDTDLFSLAAECLHSLYS